MLKEKVNAPPLPATAWLSSSSTGLHTPRAAQLLTQGLRGPEAHLYVPSSGLMVISKTSSLSLP
jgi:hypothetical protein